MTEDQLAFFAHVGSLLGHANSIHHLKIQAAPNSTASQLHLQTMWNPCKLSMTHQCSPKGYVNQLLIKLRLLPVAAYINFKTLFWRIEPGNAHSIENCSHLYFPSDGAHWQLQPEQGRPTLSLKPLEDSTPPRYLVTPVST